MRLNFFPSCAGSADPRRPGFTASAPFDGALTYLAHPLRGLRLDLCTRIVLASEQLHRFMRISGSPYDPHLRF